MLQKILKEVSFKMLFIPQMAKPLHQSSVSHDQSEIIITCWFGTQETFLILSTLKQLLCLIFLWKPW